jgi:cupin fold WbuC family metalloprotein
MKKIYSKLDQEVLLHIIYRLDDLKKGRIDIAPENEFLQVAALKLEKVQTFKPHKHIENEKITNIAQESWLVFKGSVKCIFYDLNDEIIEEVILRAGDLSMTFRGGHNYVILEEDTVVYEYKTGPYLGIENDKEFIK